MSLNNIFKKNLPLEWRPSPNSEEKPKKKNNNDMSKTFDI